MAKKQVSIIEKLFDDDPNTTASQSIWLLIIGTIITVFFRVLSTAYRIGSGRW